MSSSKTEKTKEEDDLVASISKSMTIPQLKKEIILADLWYGTKTKAKTKEDFVDIYISNGLHKRAAATSSKAVSKAASLEDKKEAQVVANAVASVSKAPTSPSASVSKAPTSPSASKAEKTKEEDDLVASISKTMTIPQLKKEIILADLWYGTKTKAKTKAEFVDIYISNGLHKRAEASVSVSKAATVSKAPKTPPKTPPTTPPKSASKAVRVEPKEELILSLMISGHGTEGPEWDPTMPVAEYYKNNVRVYSRACVPGIPSLRMPSKIRKSIDDTFTIFKNNPGSATQEIMSEYTSQDKTQYRKYLDKFECYKDNGAVKNKERCGGLITYLSSKQFRFDQDNTPNIRSEHKTEYGFNQFLESRGVNVSDIRLKITASDGSVTYRNIFNPYEEMAQFYSSNKEHKEPVDIITKFNLAYRHGIEFILKDVLHKEELIGRALEIFKFKEGQQKIGLITLLQLHRFFELVGIKYVNIIDHSCRSFNPTFNIPIEKGEERFKKEQKYIVKPVAFGKRSRRRSSSKKLSKRSDRKYKYTRKI